MIMAKHKIKILAPIDRAKEVLPLIKAGADEFFCGVLIDDENLSCKRAMGVKKSNLANLAELEKLVKIIKKRKKSIFLALNIPHDKIGAYKAIKKNIKKIKRIGVDAIIIGNIDLMDKFKESGLKIIASSLLEVKNKETAELLIKEFGVKRIILDRQITLNDIKDIISKFPTIEFETFIMASGCRSLNSACNRHLATDKKYLHMHLCISLSLINKKNKESFLNSLDRKVIAERLKMPSYSCGACALFQFKELNISSIKIVGRGMPTSIKVKNTKFIKQTLDILEKNYPRKKFYKETEKLFEKAFGEKCKRQYCYYPHFFDK